MTMSEVHSALYYVLQLWHSFGEESSTAVFYNFFHCSTQRANTRICFLLAPLLWWCMVPHVRAHLVSVWNSHIKSCGMILEMEATGSPLMEYISRTRNNWTLPVFDTIDWNVHCIMLKRMNKWHSQPLYKVPSWWYASNIEQTTNRGCNGGKRKGPLWCGGRMIGRGLRLETALLDGVISHHPSWASWQQVCLKRIPEYCA